MVFGRQGRALEGAGVQFQRVLAYRVCNVYLWPVFPSVQSPPVAQRAPHCMQQAPLTGLVCRVGGGAAVLADAHLMPLLSQLGSVGVQALPASIRHVTTDQWCAD